MFNYMVISLLGIVLCELDSNTEYSNEITMIILHVLDMIIFDCKEVKQCSQIKSLSQLIQYLLQDKLYADTF